MQAPDYIGPIKALRGFEVRSSKLYSPYRNGEWVSTMQKAECRKSADPEFKLSRKLSESLLSSDQWLVLGKSSEVTKDEEHTAPGKRCRCGLYCYKYFPPHADYYDVYAVVDIWGTIEEHRDGYRAEYMKILGLTYPNKKIRNGESFLNKVSLRRLARNYKVPVIDFKDTWQQFKPPYEMPWEYVKHGM